MRQGNGQQGEDRAKIARQFIENLPHVQALGARLTGFGDARAEIEMPWSEHLVGDPRTGVVHGGVVSALMDTCGGAAVMAHPDLPNGTATIALRIDYMRGATPRQMLRRAGRVFPHHPHRSRSCAPWRWTMTKTAPSPRRPGPSRWSAEMADRNEPLDRIKSRRNAAIGALVGGVPYLAWLGIRFDRRGDELTAVMPFSEKLIGNPMLPALHGGVTAAFLEIAAVVELTWSSMWDEMEAGRMVPDAAIPPATPRLPKTIDFSIDYLRSGLPRDSYARARVVRLGRRYASVQVEAWQDNRARPFAQANGHFLMPQGG